MVDMKIRKGKKCCKIRNVDFKKNIPNIEKHNIYTFHDKRKTG